jgi:GNAT superfamily N-acetyltransferase
MRRVGEMEWLVKDLRASDRALLAEHFLALGPEDRRLRFGSPRPDFAVREYVANIDFDRDAVFGVMDDELRLLGAAHVARADGQAELGVSVLPGHRGRGVGGALLERAALRTRNWGKRTLYIHCLSENQTMMHLARRQSMRVVIEAGEADAWLELPAADAASYFGEVFANNVALFDHALKRQRYFLSNIQSGERLGG